MYFSDLKDGAVLPPKTTINFGLRNMGVAPAGSDRENSGHHHLLIDTELPPLDQPIPNDFNHLHFGAGQTGGRGDAEAGEHTLQLLMGDKDHIPHSPPVMSARIKVRVVDPSTRKPAPTRRAGLFRRSAGLGGAAAEGDHSLRPRQHGRRAGRHRKVQYRPSPSLVNTPLPPLDQPIPNDFNHLHFGAGQTEATVTLPLGTHTLQLLLGRREPRAAQSSGHVEADQGDRHADRQAAEGR